MRCAITKPAKLRKLSALVGQPIVRAMTRGNTDHRIDAFTEDGTCYNVWPDGTFDREPTAEERAAARAEQQRAHQELQDLMERSHRGSPLEAAGFRFVRT